MSFIETIERARSLLERNGRLSLRVLKREFELDDQALDELIEELVDVQQVAAREGKVLSWMGATPAPARPAADPAAERRQLTVMFCDLVGSTALSQRLDAEDLRSVVGAYQESASAAIARYEGHVAQFLGDGLLVYFGYPQAHEDDAERAVRAGREILAGLSKLNERLEPEHGLRLSARIGIHTGPVVVGEMGSGANSETLAIGDTTNIAARLEAAAEPDTVVISGSTQRLVAGMFAIKDLGTPPLKGVGEPVAAYAVLQATGVRSRLELSGGRLTPLVGRSSELGVLINAWEHVAEGSGQTILVHGEAGLGKSRLCYELRAQVMDTPHTWLECQCSPYTAVTPFLPVIHLVEQALGFSASDLPAVRLRKLRSGLSLGGFDVAEAVPLLAEWLGLPEEAGYTPLATNPELKRSQTLETLVAWNLKLSELQPLVVLVEDLHWCDPSSLELLGRLVAQNATAPVLLVGTARPGFENPWPARGNFQALNLGRLTKRQARELIVAVSRTQAIPEDVMEQLVARADGVPLYAEELTQSVVEAGGTASTASIPVTLQDSLLARLDRLSSAKEVAQRASVLGREFSYRVLAAVAELDEATLRESLKRLVEGELLFVRGEPPEATYSFKHALTQEAAYESMLRRTRQQLHGRVVDVLEADFPAQAAAEPELVARHAEAAGRIPQAIEGYRRAGEQARRRSAYEETIRHLGQTIALLDTQPEGRERDAEESALLLVLGSSLSGARGYADPEVKTVYERVRTLCERTGDEHAEGWALAGISTFFGNSGQAERAWELADRVREIGARLGDQDLTLRGHIDLGVVELYRGDFTSSLKHLDEVLASYDPNRSYLLDSGFSLTDPGVLARNNSAWDLALLGYPERAAQRVDEARERALRIGQPYSVASVSFMKTLIHRIRRDVPRQREGAAETMALAETHGFALWQRLATMIHAEACAIQGEPEAAPDETPLAGGKGGVVSAGAPGLLMLLAETHLARGRLAEAKTAVDAGLALSAQTGEHYVDSELYRLQGEIASVQGGPPAEVEALLRRAVATARERAAKLPELRAATSLARLLREQERPAEARALLEPVYAWFSEGFDDSDLKDARTLLDELA